MTVSSLEVLLTNKILLKKTSFLKASEIFQFEFLKPFCHTFLILPRIEPKEFIPTCCICRPPPRAIPHASSSSLTLAPRAMVFTCVALGGGQQTVGANATEKRERAMMCFYPFGCIVWLCYAILYDYICDICYIYVIFYALLSYSTAYAIHSIA